MIKFENTEVVGWEHAIRGMRNPMNSWEKSDSGICKGGDDGIGCENCANYDSCEHTYDHSWQLGKADHDLMMRLAAGGSVHAKYRRMITVYVDITAPLYWWKEFDTYKVGTMANSCSTMHCIHKKEFTLEDFSRERLVNIYTLQQVIKDLNFWRNAYLINGDYERMRCVRSRFDPDKVDPFVSKKDCWWQMIQLLPSSYNQKRTVMLNYEVLANIYESRKNHKLDEWSEHKPVDIVNGEKVVRTISNQYQGFCDWIKTLPYSEIITGNEER